MLVKSITKKEGKLMIAHKKALHILALVSFSLMTAAAAAKSGYVQIKHGVQVYYELEGTGKRTIVFIHGIPGNHTEWECQAKALSKHFKVLTLDLPGSGRSSVPRKEYTAKSYAKAVHAVIHALKNDGVRNPILVTSSWSSFIALEYALRFADCHDHTAASKLVLVDGSARLLEDTCYLGFTPEQRDMLLNLIKCDYPAYVEFLLDHIVTGKCGDTPAVRQLREYLDKLFSSADASVVYGTMKNFFALDYRDKLCDITIPTLLVFGGNDQMLPRAQFYALRGVGFTPDTVIDCEPNSGLPDSIIFELCNKGHMPFLTDVKRFDREVAAFAKDDLCDCCICRIKCVRSPELEDEDHA